MGIVNIWEEEIVIPTYEIGEAEKNPIFLDKRVYQGSTGKIYPYPAVEKISDEKVDKIYKAVYLENQYLKVTILPELGGRIQRAYDKTNNYDFVYYNHVIKPALVGLTGPWISGGIEFNWPQHHRPSTYLPVDYILKENEDGSKTVLVNDVDQMYGTKGIAAFTLHPDKAYIEIKGQLYNRTSMPQTFLWWANPAVAVNEYTQSIFPPDVHAVMDHGKRDVSRFPIATGTYYKKDYSEGVDISRYKNITVPTSYMAEKSEYDFVGGYDYNLRAGILHVADHHISPGKKQWTWGCGDFGKAWDRNLTDEDGPYIELMTGVYTDNQPDFTWLKPFEEKTFTQYFMPYKAVGAVKNATIHAVVNLEKREDSVYFCVYATQNYESAKVVVYNKEAVIFEENIKISPEDIYENNIPIRVEKESDLSIKIISGKDVLVQYEGKEAKIEEVPNPAQAAKEPEEIMTIEELYLTGLHIEQYRHATYLPDPYYMEGLKRDKRDIRINNAYGSLLMKRGCFEQAENYFNMALKRLTQINPNPYDSEVYYNLGLVNFYQGKEKEAYDAFYKATWTNEQQEMSFYYLAALNCRNKEYETAFEHIQKGLVKNSHNVKARGMKAYILRNLGKETEAKYMIQESLKIDPFDYVSRNEACILNEDSPEKQEELKILMRDSQENFLQAARDYAEFGAYKEALSMLKQCTKNKPMLGYYKAFYSNRLQKNETSQMYLMEAEEAAPDYCFPNKLEDIEVLYFSIQNNKLGSKAYYYLGNLYYDKLQYEKAVSLWEQSAALNSKFPTVLRNLSLAYYNKMNRKEQARKLLQDAFLLDTTDSRVFLELDQLYKKLEMVPEERLSFYNKYYNTFIKRDDLYIEYVTLYNTLGNYSKAYDLINVRHFHPWEGGEGKITTQYTKCLLEMAKENICLSDFKKAKDYLNRALVYPENLGEGKLEGTKDNDIFYYLGCIYEREGESAKAKQCFEKASLGTQEPAGMMYYNDQPADMILYQGLAKQKLMENGAANAAFYKLLNYAEKHIFDNIRIEYFAVSLPDFLIFDEDMNRKNKAHCYYLMALGNIGLGNHEKAMEFLGKVKEFDFYHLNSGFYSKNLSENKVKLLF